MIDREFIPSGDAEADMRLIREYYSKYNHAARYPEKFIP